MIKREYMHGFTVEYESDQPHIRDGLYHLEYNLSPIEVKPLIVYAKERMKEGAQFEDKHNRQFTLLYKSSNTFVLMTRAGN